MPKLDAYKIDNFKVDGGAGFGIRSIQYGTVTIASAQYTGTATINEVGDNAVAIFLGNTVSGDTGGYLSYIDLTDSTTVTATRQSNNTGAVTVAKFMVIEFESVKSIQSGTIAITSGNSSNTATVNEVDTENALLLLNGYTLSSTSMGYIPNLYLTNGTTITASRGNRGTTTTTVAYTLVEFN